jgi:hypothetical protein
VEYCVRVTPATLAKPGTMGPMLTEDELDRLQAACREIPLTPDERVAEDFVAELFDTVLDYQNRAETVRKAQTHFRSTYGDSIRSLEDVERLLREHPDDTDLAMSLWGNRHWRRARELRGLVAFFRERDVTDLASLSGWAAGSNQADFVGHIKGLGPAVYRSLVMRLGVDTVKPDVHVLRFVAAAIGRRVSQDEAVASLEEVASRLGTSARTLDGGIWASRGRGGPGR